MGKQKYNHQIVKKMFSDIGYTLISSEYLKYSDNLDYICNNNHTTFITFPNFIKGKRCGECFRSSFPTLEKINKEFEAKGYILLSTKYINNRTKLKYICSCGEIAYQSYNSFIKGRKCKNCYKRKQNKFDIEYVREVFKKEGCILLSNEYGPYIKYDYICVCNNKHSITLDHFKHGVRCRECGFEKSEKSSKSWKEYTFPSGKTRKVQGYENHAFDELLKIYHEDEIITERRQVPKIKYSINSKKMIYYPDIYIKSKNLIIEVKSDYTYKLNRVKNIIKAIATKKYGFFYEFWVYRNGNKLKFY